MVDKELVQRELDKIRTYKEARALNMQPFLLHLVRGRTGHFIVSEIEREGLPPVQQRYGLSDNPSLSQDGVDISNLEGLAKSIYIPQMFLEFQGFPVFSYDDRNGLSYLEGYLDQNRSAEVVRLLNSTIAPASEKLTRLAGDSAFRQDCLRYSELFIEAQLARLKNVKLIEQVNIDPKNVGLLTNLGEIYLSEIKS